MILTGELWTYLADLNEQAQERLDTIMEQMKATEGVTEELNVRKYSFAISNDLKGKFHRCNPLFGSCSIQMHRPQVPQMLDTIMEQMKATEGVTEELKRTSQMEWVQRCNNIHNRVHTFRWGGVLLAVSNPGCSNLRQGYNQFRFLLTKSAGLFGEPHSIYLWNLWTVHLYRA